MADLIDRQALMQDIGESVVFTSRPDMPSAELRGANKITDRIKAAPTIDPESLRPKGEWIGKQLDKFRMWEAKCSKCGWTGIENYDAYVDPFDFNFCPNCGADMRGDSE